MPRFVVWEETKMQRSQQRPGSMAVNYERVPVALHAVPSGEQLYGTATLCGREVTRDGLVTEIDFVSTPLPVRCSVCNQAIGQGYLTNP
jgi:hypothetical protein